MTRRELERAISRHVKAQIALSWMGGRDPESWPEIKKIAKRCKEQLRAKIDDLEHIMGAFGPRP